MLTRDISKPEQVSNAKTNPEINETSEGLPKKLEKEQVSDDWFVGWLKCVLITLVLITLLIYI